MVGWSLVLPRVLPLHSGLNSYLDNLRPDLTPTLHTNDWRTHLCLTRPTLSCIVSLTKGPPIPFRGPGSHVIASTSIIWSMHLNKVSDHPGNHNAMTYDKFV